MGESQNIIGKTDLHITQDNKTVYVLELKVNNKAENCIKQIEEKYEKHYRQHFEKTVKIGINWKRKEKESKEVDVIISEVLKA